MYHSTAGRSIPEAEDLGQEMTRRLSCYLSSLLGMLDARMDVRLVRTFAATVVNVLRHRDRALSLVLTELGELLTDGAHAPAGVKRLWRLLHSAKWQATEIDDWLLTEADQAVTRARERDGVAFAILDGSVIEKPTAKKWAGLTKIRSAVAARLQRANGGPPPKRPLVVPGFGWVAAVVTGWRGSLTLATLHWYSPKAPGDLAQQQRQAEWHVLRPLLARWGRQVVWLMDRGFGNQSFVGELLQVPVRLIVRWRRDYRLTSAEGQTLPASQLTRPVRSRWKVQLFDARTGQTFSRGVASLPITLPESGRPLWLVVGRRKGKKPLWLLTTEDASTEAGALWVVQAYTRRWQVEWAFRFEKADLGVASIRVSTWGYRQKLWRIAVLVHAFLLQVLVLAEGDLVPRLLRWCHRTGRRYREAIAPLYRLRHALANLWSRHLPTLAWSP